MNNLKYLATTFVLLSTCAPSLRADDAQRKNGPEQLLKRHPELTARYRALEVGKAFADKWRETSDHETSPQEYNYKFNIAAHQARNLIVIGSPALKFDGPAVFPLAPKIKDGIDSNPLYAANRELLINQTDLGYRIVGGGECGLGEFMDCVAVLGQQNTQCTGTLIASKLVLTAGHCASHGGPRKIFVGQHVGSPDGKYYNVKKPYVSPQNRPDGTAPDLLLLELEQPVDGVDPVPIASTQVPATFPSANDPVDFRLLRIAGFGRDRPDGSGTTGIKRFADVPAAAGPPKDLGFRPDDEFVAGLEGLYIDTCNGDSGGPVYAYVVGEDRWYLIGCTSRSTHNPHVKCGDGGVYTRVDRYRDWIESVAKGLGLSLP